MHSALSGFRIIVGEMECTIGERVVDIVVKAESGIRGGGGGGRILEGVEYRVELELEDTELDVGRVGRSSSFEGES